MARCGTCGRLEIGHPARSVILPDGRHVRLFDHDPGLKVCRSCGDLFDPRSLQEVFWHEHDPEIPLPVPDIRGVRVE